MFFKVHFRVQGSGFRVQGSGFRVVKNLTYLNRKQDEDNI